MGKPSHTVGKLSHVLGARSHAVGKLSHVVGPSSRAMGARSRMDRRPCAVIQVEMTLSLPRGLSSERLPCMSGVRRVSPTG